MLKVSFQTVTDKPRTHVAVAPTNSASTNHCLLSGHTNKWIAVAWPVDYY